MSKKRRSFSAEFKAKVGLEALKGIEPIHVIAQRHEVHPVQVSQWKKEVAERLPEVFSKPSKQVRDEIERDRKEKDLYAEIGQLKMELDWHSRKVLAWELSNTLDASFCVRAVERAMAIYGQPEIFNTDQGSQFTSAAFTQPLLAAGVRLSMDGKGRCLDNVFIERLWRSVKHEEVYLRRYETMIDAHAHLDAYFRFYNERRPHSAHGRQTPAEVYAAHLPEKAAA